MFSKNKHIKSTIFLTRSKIAEYQTSDIDANKNLIEMKANEDLFEKDALEGFLENKINLSSMKKMDARFKRKNSSVFWSIGVFCFLSFLVYFMFPSSQNQRAHTNQMKRQTIEKTDITLPKYIAIMDELPAMKQIHSQQLKTEFAAIDKQQESSFSEINPTLYEKRVQPIPIAIPENSIIHANLMAKEIYLHDLKLIDYREYRSQPKISTEQILLTGTPANIDNLGNKNEEAEWKTVEIPYIDYLDRTIALFSKGQNKKALSRLQTILATYPDDINANFYSGLCFYNLKEFSSAQHSFENCMLSKYMNFQEEAEWYLALSASANGQLKESIELFNLIVKRGGYYSKEARKALAN
jgi:hypothetical protein